MALTTRSIPRTKRAPQLLADSAPMRCALDRLALSMANPATVPRPEFRQSLRSVLVAEAAVLAANRPPRRPPKVRRSKGGFRLAALGIGISAAGGGLALAANQVTTTPAPVTPAPATAPDPHQVYPAPQVTRNLPPSSAATATGQGQRTVGGKATGDVSRPAVSASHAPLGVVNGRNGLPSLAAGPSTPSLPAVPAVPSVGQAPNSAAAVAGEVATPSPSPLWPQWQGRWSPAPLLPSAAVTKSTSARSNAASHTDQGGLGPDALEVP
jgi:hypothetical protein